MVDDGQVVVLGGLIEEQIKESVQKVPFLGDIPFLGALFRSKTSDVSKANLMVFIHPVILRDGAVTNNYTNSKYNYIRALQMQQDEDGVNLLPDKRHPVLPVMEEFSSVPGVTPVLPRIDELSTVPGTGADAGAEPATPVGVDITDG
jgi:general secretion pathway protein D